MTTDWEQSAPWSLAISVPRPAVHRVALTQPKQPTTLGHGSDDVNGGALDSMGVLRRRMHTEQLVTRKTISKT